MIHEYAVEPELVTTWVDRQRGRYFIERFGLGQPRIISQYPKPWKRLVWEAFRGQNELERKRMEELIARLGETMVRRRNAPWDAGLTWIENAVEEHARLPFHAILSSANRKEHAQVLAADELEDSVALWAVPRGRTIRRTAGDMAAAVASMLRIAEVVVFVDPYFGPENARHRRPLAAFLRSAVVSRVGAGPVRLELYCSADSGASEEFFREECLRRLSLCIPAGMTLTLRRLRARSGGERLHNRYILTDVGGVAFGVGLDEEGGSGGSTDDVLLLERALYQERWRQYVDDGLDFDRPEAAVKVEGAG